MDAKVRKATILARVPCAVIGCGRTCAKGKWLEFLCQKHYPMVKKRLRRLRTRVHRKAKRIGWTPALMALENRLWAMAKRQAIEAAVGIG